MSLDLEKLVQDQHMDLLGIDGVRVAPPGSRPSITMGSRSFEMRRAGAAGA